MNDDLLKAIHQELVAIRQLLADGKAPAMRSTPVRASAPSGAVSRSNGGEEEAVPQPTEIIANAGDVQVHFGKNNGVALAKLSERSLSWYAQEQAPRLDSSGNPYPARPQEITLRNAARTLWHQNRGTLGGGATGAKSSTTATEAFVEPSGHPADNEDSMPF
jgi:hypothetical protein